MEEPVGLGGGNVAPHLGEGGLDAAAGLERAEKLQALGRAHELDGEDSLGVLDALEQLGGADGAHRDVVLLAERGGDGVNRGRVGEALVFGNELGGGVLRNSETA